MVSCQGKIRIDCKRHGWCGLAICLSTLQDGFMEGIQAMIPQRKPTHPGVVLRKDVLKPPGLTITDAAKRLRIHQRTLSALPHEKTSLSPAMAVRIGKATKTSPESWLYMQAKLDLWKVAQGTTDVEEFTRSEIG